MGWRIRVFTELLSPVEPFKSTYILAIVENEQGERKIARIPSKYFGLVSEGVEGDITEEWTVFGKVTVFIPRLNGYPRRVVLVTGGSR
ncbi:MAG: hypothetical protein ACP5IE_02425, partial [Infirmifilum sp.]